MIERTSSTNLRKTVLCYSNWRLNHIETSSSISYRLRNKRYPFISSYLDNSPVDFSQGHKKIVKRSTSDYIIRALMRKM